MLGILSRASLNPGHSHHDPFRTTNQHSSNKELLEVPRLNYDFHFLTGTLLSDSGIGSHFSTFRNNDTWPACVPESFLTEAEAKGRSPDPCPSSLTRATFTTTIAHSSESADLHYLERYYNQLHHVRLTPQTWIPGIRPLLPALHSQTTSEREMWPHQGPMVLLCPSR